MGLKFVLDRIVSLIGIIILIWLFIILFILIKIRMPGPAFFIQYRVGKNGKLFCMFKFRTMQVNNVGPSISVAGSNNITPLGAKLRKYKFDELPELLNVLIGNMSLVGPRPDVPGYADCLLGQDREVLQLRPGITGPASLKYRNEEELINEFVRKEKLKGDPRLDQEIAIWYNDNVIYPDKVRLNRYYLHNYSIIKDIQMVFCTVFGKRMHYAGEWI